MSPPPGPYSSIQAYIKAQGAFLRRFDIAWTLAKRELKARYRGSWLGFFWALTEPFLLICIFFFVFVIIFNQNYPNYLLYLTTGLLPFSFFNNALLKATGSIVGNTALIRQIYGPRQLFVMVGILSELHHFAFSLVVLPPFYWYYGLLPGVQVVAVIPITLALALFCFGLGLFLGAFNVFVRDTSIFVGLALRMWFYITPIFYTIERLNSAPDLLRHVYYLNPLVTILELYRWALINEPFPEWPHVGIVIAETIFILIAGSLYFYRHENDMVKML